MNWKLYLGFLIAGLVVVILPAALQTTPGYMDAEYYYSMALRIVNNHGFSEPFVWNYLNNVDALPHPGFSYWMPMPALLSALGIWISGFQSFLGAKIIHLLIAACLPVLVVRITWQLTTSAEESVLAGLFVLFPVFYNIFLGTTDSFAFTMLLGGLFFALTRMKEQWFVFLVLGAIAGLMHLTRADGLIWLVGGFYFALRSDQKKSMMLVWVAAGYFLFMGPWFIRNQIALGQFMPAGTSKVFWLTEYDQLFSLHTARLTYQNWAAQGVPAILNHILTAALANLKTALLVQGQAILTPFILIGAWQHRRDSGLQALALVWLALFLLMSLVFPFAGMRGGFLHASAAFQPVLWALAAGGFFQAISWGVRRRDWQKAKAGTVFGAALLTLVALASVFIFLQRVIGAERGSPIWNQSYQQAIAIDRYLTDAGLDKNEPVLINNPPGLYAAARRSAVVIPNDGIEAVLEVGHKFGAQYLVLEKNHSDALDPLYHNPGIDQRLELAEEIGDTLIFLLPESWEGGE